LSTVSLNKGCARLSCLFNLSQSSVHFVYSRFASKICEHRTASFLNTQSATTICLWDHNQLHPQCSDSRPALALAASRDSHPNYDARRLVQLSRGSKSLSCERPNFGACAKSRLHHSGKSLKLSSRLDMLPSVVQDVLFVSSFAFPVQISIPWSGL
jgi:hypothetical protein